MLDRCTVDFFAPRTFFLLWIYWRRTLGLCYWTLSINTYSLLKPYSIYHSTDFYLSSIIYHRYHLLHTTTTSYSSSFLYHSLVYFDLAMILHAAVTPSAFVLDRTLALGGLLLTFTTH